MKLQHKFRASSISEIMTDPKGKDEVLSVGAKTYLEKLAKQFVYGYDEVISGKYMDKGIQVEDQTIELINRVFFTNYKKNTERRSNEWVTGECDILVPGVKIIDAKSSWSLATFPATSKAGEDKGYEWQGRVYMMLWDVPEFEINYGLVNTPDDLIGYEDTALHYVDHIEPELRVTRVCYHRDLALEEKIKTKCEAAQAYLDKLIHQIADEHNY